jgi:hypothetical protein
VILPGLLLLACGSLPKAPPELDVQAKTFEPQAGLARVYVYRLGKVWLGRYDSRIFIVRGDSSEIYKYVGVVSKKRYVFADLPPGKYSLGAITMLYEGGVFKDIARNALEIGAVEGGVYFVRVEVPNTWPVDPPDMQLVTAAEGMAAVRDCQLTALP